MKHGKFKRGRGITPLENFIISFLRFMNFVNLTLYSTFLTLLFFFEKKTTKRRIKLKKKNEANRQKKEMSWKLKKLNPEFASFKIFKFAKSKFSESIKQNFDVTELNDRDNLPGFYYRDDAMELWQIMERYVRNVLRCYYECDPVSLAYLSNELFYPSIT